MTFLAKLGSIIKTGLSFVPAFLPLIAGLAPSRAAQVESVADDLTKISGIVAAIEVVGQAMTAPAPGAEKLKMAAPLVAQVILQSDVLVGRKIKNPELFQQGCANIAGGMADVMNSLDD